MEVAAKIVELRKKKGWTQLELALKGGFSPSRISRIENGAKLWGEDIKKLAAVFGVSEELFFRNESK